ncbi:hypothetical protein PUMCH_003529 [Australozyma saopauloensis]|uniref:Uncharacterized protein n=1 Tax=Australozyma saopauloensis TaxID=291208 RepID=A0AAX4HCP4_9ASCO|nr:hypothetical protein PUMCH_003529 [[Candida] saopauloensis]
MSATTIEAPFALVQTEELRKYSIASQTGHILRGEYEEWRKRTMDVTISEISGHIPPIPPKKYLTHHVTLTGHLNKVVDIKFSPDSKKLLSVCQDGFGIIWDVLSGLKLQAIPLVHRWALACSYSPSGKLVAVAGLENKCTMYNVNVDLDELLEENSDSIELSKRGQSTMSTQHQAYIGVLEFLSDREVITGSGDSLIRLWDVEKRCKIREYTEHSGDITSVLIAPQDLKTPWSFYSSGADGHVRLWDCRQPKCVHSFSVSVSDVNVVTQSPDGNSFVSGDDLGRCQLFDIRSLCPIESYVLQDQFEYKKEPSAFGILQPNSSLHVPPPPPSPGLTASNRRGNGYDISGVTSIAISKSGRIMYTCYADYSCICWDLFQKKIVERVGVGSVAHHDRVDLVRVSEDGQGLATASWDTTVKIWTC